MSSEVIHSNNNNADVKFKLNKMINISQPFCTDQQDIDRFDQIKSSINNYNEVSFSSKSEFFNINNTIDLETCDEDTSII